MILPFLSQNSKLNTTAYRLVLIVFLQWWRGSHSAISPCTMHMYPIQQMQLIPSTSYLKCVFTTTEHARVLYDWIVRLVAILQCSINKHWIWCVATTIRGRRAHDVQHKQTSKYKDNTDNKSLIQYSWWLTEMWWYWNIGIRKCEVWQHNL